MGLERFSGAFMGGKGVLNRDLGEPKFDRALTSKYFLKHRGSVRIGSGKFYTKDEWAEKKRELLAKAMP